MKFKKYTGPSLPEVMKKVRAELGQNAVIINSKTVHKGGVLGLFRKKQIEVVAAIDPIAAEPMKLPVQPVDKPLPPKEPIKKERIENKKEESIDVNLLLKEIQRLKEDMQSSNTGIIVPEALKPHMNRLLEQGVAPYLLKSFSEKITEIYYQKQKPVNQQAIKNLIADIIFENKESLLNEKNLLSKKFVALIGPTGVGKTTTLAKLAAKSILKNQKKVAFITTDTYRIAAIEQLKTYANIVGAPIEVCYNLEDFKRAKQRFVHYDTIFIDTAGRNFRNSKYVEDLNQVIDFKEDVETYLTIALTAKEADVKQMIEQFSALHIDRFIFTKLDETSQCGMMLNLIWDTGIGVGYITNGQNVPDDLQEADRDLIVSYLLGKEN